MLNIVACDACALVPHQELTEDWSRVHGPGDDEEEFGSNHAERKGQHACALGRSIAVHFSYNMLLDSYLTPDALNLIQPFHEPLL